MVDSGIVTAGPDQEAGAITRADVAAFCLDALLEPDFKFLKQAVSISSNMGSGFESVLSLLVFEGKATLDLKMASDGRTALHCAAQEGHLDCVRQLLLAGASPQLRAKNGSTAAALASAGKTPGHRAVALALEEAVAKAERGRRGSRFREKSPASSTKGAKKSSLLDPRDSLLKAASRSDSRTERKRIAPTVGRVPTA